MCQISSKCSAPCRTWSWMHGSRTHTYRQTCRPSQPSSESWSCCLKTSLSFRGTRSVVWLLNNPMCLTAVDCTRISSCPIFWNRVGVSDSRELHLVEGSSIWALLLSFHCWWTSSSASPKGHWISGHSLKYRLLRQSKNECSSSSQESTFLSLDLWMEQLRRVCRYISQSLLWQSRRQMI